MCYYRLHIYYVGEPSSGASSHIILGARDDKLDAHVCCTNTFITRIALMGEFSGLKWNHVLLYGDMHTNHKKYFLIYIVHVFSCNNFPLVVGVDF
jgi:hypothetical protein